MPLASGTQLQEFVVERLIGVGGFGIVYLAQDTLLHRRVAIKEYMPTATAARFDGVTVSVRSQSHAEEFELGKRSFINEARMLARFKHASLLEVFRFWEQHGTAYMAMPFYEGVTLKEHVKQHGALQNEEALKQIIDPLLDALDYMHHDSVYHRDIAPDNIMLLANGRPVLLDLGAARTVSVEAGGQALTVLVKPGYAPVEQYADDASIRQGPWTDIYALGAVAWFSIMGKAPPPSASRMLRDVMPSLSGSGVANFSSKCLEALDGALRIRPEDRPQTVMELRANLGWSGAITTPERQKAAKPRALPDAAITPAKLPIVASPAKLVVPENTAPEAALVEPTAVEAAPSIVELGIKDSTEPIVYEPLEPTVVVPKKAISSVATAQAKVDKTTPEVIAQTQKKPASKGFNKGLVAAGLAATALIAAIALFSKDGEKTAPEAIALKPPAEPSPIQTTTPPVEPPTATVRAESPPVTVPDNPEPAVKPDTASPKTPDMGELPKPAPDPNVPGLVRLNIKPWGEVFVNGQSRVVSPPNKFVSLPPGEYTIEVRNMDNPTSTFRTKLGSGEQFVITHDFATAKSSSTLIASKSSNKPKIAPNNLNAPTTPTKSASDLNK